MKLVMRKNGLIEHEDFPFAPAEGKSQLALARSRRKSPAFWPAKAGEAGGYWPNVPLPPLWQLGPASAPQ
jgi:hypothetical protein